MKRIAVAIVLLALCGCTTYYIDRAKAQRKIAEADLVLEFYTWDQFSVSRPPEAAAKFTSRDAFVKALPAMNVGRKLAVVLLDKRANPEGKPLNAVMDDVEKALKGQGFGKVIFEIPLASGRPDDRAILR